MTVQGSPKYDQFESSAVILRRGQCPAFPTFHLSCLSKTNQQYATETVQPSSETRLVRDNLRSWLAGVCQKSHIWKSFVPPEDPRRPPPYCSSRRHTSVPRPAPLPRKLEARSPPSTSMSTRDNPTPTQRLRNELAYLAQGAFVTLTCAPAVPRGPVGRTAFRSGTRSCGSCGRLDSSIAAPPLVVAEVALSGTLEYGMPGPTGPGMRVACAHGAAVVDVDCEIAPPGMRAA